jgi:PAS domain S-box-containing protein
MLATDSPGDLWRRIGAIFEAVPTSLITTDHHGHIQSANRSALRLFDCTPEDLVGLKLQRFLPELRLETATQPAPSNQRRAADIVWLETTAQRPDGSLFLVKHAVSRLELEGASALAHVVLDISERKRRESALEESRARVRAILETIPLAIVTTDQDGTIETFNLAAEPLFQFTSEEVIGEPIELLIPDLTGADTNLRSLLYGGAGRKLRARRRDGSEFPIELGVGSMNLAGGELLAFAIKDISARVRAENEAHEARAQLIEAEKLASLGELVAGVAHEINTPVGIGVTAVSHLREKYEALQRSYLENGLKRSSLEEFLHACDQSTQIIQSNLRRASELINSFKQVAVDRSSSEQRRFLVKEFIDELLLSLRPRLKRTGHRFEVNCEDSLAITSYPGALSQILTNFIMNSLLHAYDAQRAGRITIAVKQLGDQIELSYADDGKGIKGEHLRRIFHPFFTTERGGGGSGLGLHIVYNLVKKALGGSIRCESAPGKGTRYVIRFPQL